MTKAQRSARAKRAGAKRRKASAIKAFMKKMNPSRKVPAAVRVKRLKGGGISVTPIKMNAGPLSIRQTKKRLSKAIRTGYTESPKLRTTPRYVASMRQYIKQLKKHGKAAR